MSHSWESLLRTIRRARRMRAGKRSRRVRPMLLVLSLVGLIFVFSSALNGLKPSPSGERLTLDGLDRLAKVKSIATATFRDEDALIEGTYRAGKETKAFWLPYPKSDLATGALIKVASEAGARVSVDQQTGKAQLRMVTTFVLPLAMLANLFALLFTSGRGGGSGIGDVIVFGSFRKRRVRSGHANRVTFADVAGADHAVAELAEIVDYLKNPGRYREIGAHAPKGVLMIGPPGCGKTLLAKACAGEADVPFFSVAGAEFVESLVGVGAARVRDLFRRVRAAAPAIVFIDELDAAGRRRGSGAGTGGSDEREQTLNQLLVEMDGFDATAGIVVIAATNRPDILDPALLRPGRFDRQVSVDQPGRDGRREILTLHGRARKVASGVDYELIARRTPGFSGAELANVINEAALLAIRSGSGEVKMEHMLEGVERVIAGPQKRSHVLTAQERTRIAAHEAGHAVVAAAFGDAGEVQRVSVLRRGGTFGVTTGSSETGLITPTTAARKLAELMAGLVAEQRTCGEPSSAAEADLAAATRLGTDVVARYGMSERLGRTRLLAPAAEAFLDNRIPLTDLSSATHEALDAEVRRLLAGAEATAERILSRNGTAFEMLVAALESEETLDGTPLQGMLAAVRLPEDAPKRRRQAAGIASGPQN